MADVQEKSKQLQQEMLDFDNFDLFYNSSMEEKSDSNMVLNGENSQEMNTDIAEFQKKSKQSKKSLKETAKKIVQSKFNKFSDVFQAINKRKQEEKLQKIKHQQLMQANVGEINLYNDDNGLNIDSIINAGQNMMQPNYNQQQQNSLPYSLHHNANKQSMANDKYKNMDLDIDNKAIDVYMSYNIMDQYLQKTNPDYYYRENSFSVEEENEENEINQKTQALTNNLDELTEAKTNHVFRDLDNEDCFSEDDKDFLEMFPDPCDQKYMELNVKLHLEGKRRMQMHQNAFQNQQVWH